MSDKIDLIKTWIRQGHKQVDIAKRTGFSKSYISKIKRQMEQEPLIPNKLVLYRFLDHCALSNGYEIFKPAEQVVIGIPINETEEEIVVKCHFSLTLDKPIYTIHIIKSAIIEAKQYRLVNDLPLPGE